jgi:death on curing protein
MSWHWLMDEVVGAMHDELMAEHGGRVGVRDAGLLASALARPQNQSTFGEPSVFDLAAAYAFGIVRNHPFIDGNKRTGFLAAYVFLDLNGWELKATEADAVSAVWALAAGEMIETGFSDWIRNRSVMRAARE